MYAAGDYDLAGFAVGAVERDQLITGASVAPGDTVLGLASSGVHSNGFSLVRRIVADSRVAWTAPAPFARDTTLAEALLAPTRIYVKSGLSLARRGLVKAMAHITGGGLVENVPRVIPDTMTVEIDATKWTLPPVFAWLAKEGGVSAAEMTRVFNCGIGMIAVVDAGAVAEATKLLRESGEQVFEIGRVVDRREGMPGCVVANLARAWG
jgi:phosphoribosylformylglycinamidine cyclo-ligase